MKEAATAFDRARTLLARDRLDEALAALDELLAEHPHHVEGLLLKGHLLLEARRGQEALEVCRRASAARPRSSEALNAVARCLHALGRDEEALAMAEQARRALPEGENFRQTAPVYLTLVWCLREMGRLREALDAAEEGLSRAPDAVLGQWACQVEEELEEAEQERC